MKLPSFFRLTGGSSASTKPYVEGEPSDAAKAERDEIAALRKKKKAEGATKEKPDAFHRRMVSGGPPR